MKTINYISLGLAILLLLCLFPFPYGYYILVRFISMVVFACLGFKYLNEEKQTLAIVFFALAVLFQPFIKIALGREMWNVVDVVVAAGLIYMVYKTREK